MPPLIDPEQIRFDASGLVPVIAQDAASNRVLMLAYMNREALEKTLESGWVHYWSRSRNTLWKKGATSGNLQRLIELRVDCDADSLLARVDQTGPACHRLTPTCFDPVPEDSLPDSTQGES